VVTEVVEAEGHLIDSQLLNVMFDTVVRHDAAFEVLEFRIGRTNEEPSFVSMRISAKVEPVLTEVLEELVALGCRLARAEDVLGVRFRNRETLRLARFFARQLRLTKATAPRLPAIVCRPRSRRLALRATSLPCRAGCGARRCRAAQACQAGFLPFRPRRLQADERRRR